MKALILFFILFSSNCTFAQELKIKPLNKIPKSLFLVKKANIENEINEPIIHPAEKQSQLIQKEKVFNKYRLEFIEK